MKNSLVFILLFVGTVIGSIFLPWWIVAPSALIFTYFSRTTALEGFFIPLLAVFLAWLASIFFYDDGAIREILGKLFQVHALLTPFIAALVGGLVSGLFGLAGALLVNNRR